MTIELTEPHNTKFRQPTDVAGTPADIAVTPIPASTKVETKGTTAIVISTITGVTLISSLLSGLVTISLPAMAKDLDIPQALVLWSAEVGLR